MHLTNIIKEAIFVLKKGGVIVYPTDTAYALGAKFSVKAAVSRIYKIKNRPAGKLLPVIVGSLPMARKFFSFSKQELGLAKKYWPGPLSLVLKLKKSKSEIPVRVPGSKMAREFSRVIGVPLISTSANLSGAGECYSPCEVIRQFDGKKYHPDLIFYGGKLRKRKPSTIVKVIGKEIKILRPGPIKI